MTGPPIQAVVGTQSTVDESRRSWGMVFFKEDGTPFFGGATELAELTDVDLTSLADGDILVWDTTTSKWVRTAAPSGGATDTDAWHAVGGSGEPAFGSGWSNSSADITGDDPGTRPVAAFRKIPGAVALRGIVAGTYGTPIFTLPAGYRPSATHIFATTGQTAPYRLHVEPNGQVLFSDGPTTTPTWLVLTTIIPLDPP
jgi:hypothetical protein